MGRDQVRGTRAGRRDADADLAGHLRVALGRVAGALLVADQDVAHLRVVERIVGREDGTAGDAEEYFDADPLQGLHQRLGSGQDLW